MVEQLHWLPFSTHMQFKVLILVLKSQMGLAPNYLIYIFNPSLSATSLSPLRSFDRLDLFVPLSEPPWLNTDSLPAYVPIHGMDFTHQSAPLSSLVVFRHLSVTSK